MTAAIAANVMGAPQIDIWDGTQEAKFTVGQLLDFFDPVFGFGKMVYSMLASGSMMPGRIVTLSDVFAIADNPNTANTGRPVGVLRSKMDATLGPVYGFVQLAGQAPAQVQAGFASAGGPVFFGAAGNINSTAAAGKQLLSAFALAGQNKTVVRQCQPQAGSKRLMVPTLDGLFPGMAVSGTGIAGSSTIASLESGSTNAVILNNAATGSAAASVTFTYTNFALLQFNYPFVQGQIT